MARARTLLVGLVGVAGLVATLILGEPPGWALYVAYAGTGAYLAIRRPANHLGWLLMLVGWGLGLGSAGTYLPPNVDPTGDGRLQLVAWASSTAWSIAFFGMLAILLTFPEGRLPAGRFRWLAQVALGLQAAIAILIMTGPTITLTTSVVLVLPNPFAVLPDSPVWQWLQASDDSGLYPAMLVLMFLGLLVMLARSRRAEGMARQQFRWLIAAFVLEFAAAAGWAILTFWVGLPPNGIAWLLTVAVFAAVPLAVAVSVLRYRLYEIDRVISRSVSWGIVTGILVLTFAGLVIGLQTLLDGFTQRETLAVAASTLVAFALFQPVRRRVHRAVDRRFDRARYDAERTVTAFAERLRDEVDLATLAAELQATAGQAVRPASATIWLVDRGAR
jgi:hypothetical protein